jgi:putative ABC transport system permease protein
MIPVSKKKIYRRRRALLTVTAVAISVSLLVSMLSVGNGLRDFTYEEIKDSKEDIVITSPSRHGISNGHEIRDEIAEWREVECGLARLNEFISVNISGKKRFALAEGVVPDDAWKFLPKSYRKRFDGWFTHGDDPHYENNYTGDFTYEVLISSSLAKDFDLKRGMTINLAKSSNGLERTYVIKGIFDTDFSGEGVFEGYYFISIHLSELQTILGLDVIGNRTVDVVDTVSFFLDEDVRTEKGKVDELILRIEVQFPLFEGMVLSKDDRLKDVEGLVNLANGFNMAIGLVSVVIGILFVICVMVISVYERTSVIGMMRAIGISKRSIFLWTFRESIFLVGLGSVIGLVPGYFISDLIGKYFSYSYGLNVYLSSFTPLIALQAVVTTVIIGSLASLFPAWIATRMNVILALKHHK